jgi:hypothetical protein
MNTLPNGTVAVGAPGSIARRKAEKEDAAKGKTIALKEYTIEVQVVPSILEIKLGTAKMERRTVKVLGYSRKDAMRRAGIL